VGRHEVIDVSSGTSETRENGSSVDPRERDILSDIRRGMKQREIASKYHVRPSVVTAIRRGALLTDERLSRAGSVGEMAKVAFTEFVAGRTPADVVMKYEFDLNLTERFYADFKVMNGPILDCERCHEEGERDGIDEATASVTPIEINVIPCRYCGRRMRWNLSNPKHRQQIMGMLVKGGIRRAYHSRCKPS
jgi:hypothetical protein